MNSKRHSARFAVIVGPQGVGKTTLLKQIVKRAGAEPPAFDNSDEADEFGTTVEPNFARIDYLGETWTFADCPGSVELFDSTSELMNAADIVILVADPHADRAFSLAQYFNFLDSRSIPHVLFINRLDESETRVRDLLGALQSQSTRPLVLRQAPLRENGRIVGAVDLVSERAWKYREGKSSDLIELPESEKPREMEARESLLDTLADFDDSLLEQILEDRTPPSEELFRLMAKELEDDLIAPVTLGSAVHGHGVTRLLKLLRHEAPEPEKAAARLGVSESASAAAVIRTAFAPHVGKVSLVRIWRGALKDGASINRARVSGLFYPHGEERIRADVAGAGELAGIPRIDALEVGDWILDGTIEKRPAERLNGFLFAMAVRAKNDKEEVKLSTALQKLLEEDLSLSTERRADTGETVLIGRGDVHLRLAAAKLKSRYNVEVEMKAPKAAYRETIKGSADHHARHKKQSGGHGQFADIRVKIKPQSRGAGFKFDETIHGGSVPKQFIPAVESGVKEELASGPLGFPVVDVAVTLYDGQVHAVDSNEMSFKMAGRQAMREALPACQPVLLEPICATSVFSPSSHASKVRSVLSARRGQILGYGARDGWPGWESVNVMMPEAAMQDLIIELRSITQGAATFESKFDHYQEIQGKEADKIVQERRRELYG